LSFLLLILFHSLDRDPCKIHIFFSSLIARGEHRSMQDIGIGPATGGTWDKDGTQRADEMGVGPAIAERVSHVRSHPE
jgi:hypothetical protein